MKTTHEAISSEPNYTRRRIAAVVLAGLALLGARDIVRFGEHVVSTDIHFNREYSDFTNPSIAKQIAIKGYTKDEVVKITVPIDGLYPQHLAQMLGAKDIRVVGDEISAQVGGQDSMSPGETVVLPVDQFKAYPTQPK
jgi:hypothetical protein